MVPKVLILLLIANSTGACLENGVFCVPGDLCFAEGNVKNCVRISVVSLVERRIETGLKAFIKTCQEFV